jgi:hypothetical protein
MALAAEEKWLSIVNFVMNLLVDFLNDGIKKRHGAAAHKFELMSPSGSWQSLEPS